MYNSLLYVLILILGARSLTQSNYPIGSGPIFLEGVICGGDESRLLDCSTVRQLGLARCDHSSDTMLHCKGNLKMGGVYTYNTHQVLGKH